MPLAQPTLRTLADFASSIVVDSLLGANPTACAPPRLKRNLPWVRPRRILIQAPGLLSHAVEVSTDRRRGTLGIGQEPHLVGARALQEHHGVRHITVGHVGIG